MRKGPFIPIISAILIIAGMAIVGFSVVQKVEMKANSGSYVLPELVFQNRTALHTSANKFVPPKRGDFLGTLAIPALSTTLPIYEGTENSQLKKGVGHFEGSVLPGIQDNSVLAGHRDSVFSQLGKLKIGQLLIVDTQKGEFTYRINKFRIVKADDRTVIVPTENAVLTLSTCYPFYFFGNAPKRFIVSAALISSANLAKG